MVPSTIITMNRITVRLMLVMGLIFTHSPSTRWYRVILKPARASISGWLMLIDSREIRLQMPLARKLPVRVVMKGGTFR